MSDDIEIEVTGAPERIWLNIGEVDESTTFDALDGVTWCDASQDAWDIEYVRADLAKPAKAPSEAGHETSADGSLTVQAAVEGVLGLYTGANRQALQRLAELMAKPPSAQPWRVAKFALEAAQEHLTVDLQHAQEMVSGEGDKWAAEINGTLGTIGKGLAAIAAQGTAEGGGR